MASTSDNVIETRKMADIELIKDSLHKLSE